jgi:hypothetical protein
MIQWQPVYTTPMPMRAELIKVILEEHGISTVIVNKQDSAYKAFGDFEIHVPRNEVIKAIKILENEVEFE